MSLEFIAGVVASLGKNYVTPKDLSRVLGISTRSAGRVLRALEGRGYVSRYSNKAYRVIVGLPALSWLPEDNSPPLVVRFP
ncbi:MAG: MarR family transcriptional regulator [Acidilobus sp.]